MQLRDSAPVEPFFVITNAWPVADLAVTVYEVAFDAVAET